MRRQCDCCGKMRFSVIPIFHPTPFFEHSTFHPAPEHTNVCGPCRGVPEAERDAIIKAVEDILEGQEDWEEEFLLEILEKVEDKNYDIEMER